MSETLLESLPIGGRVWFVEDKRPFTVQARDERFLVCTKPFSARKTVLYTIVDLKEGMRGTDGFVFGLGYEMRDACKDALKTILEHGQGISRRNCVTLNVIKVAA